MASTSTSASIEKDVNLIEIKDVKISPDNFYEYTDIIKSSQAPLVIDNGSYQCRVGWSFADKPQMVFRNLIAKPRKDRTKNAPIDITEPKIQIGNDIANIEALRFQLKTQVSKIFRGKCLFAHHEEGFDRNVVTHYYNQEQIFDYIFTHLNIDNDGSVPHPIVMTECMANPNYCRNAMNELLFESYEVPAVCYGIDSLFSFHRNKITDHGLIINFGYHSTHVIPVLNGKMIPEKSKRLNVGGFHMITFMYRLLQLKYPVHLNSITISRIEYLLHNHSTVVVDYIEDLKQWAYLEYYEKNVKIVQLPFIQPPPTTQLTAEQKIEKKREQAKRLTEINNRKRESKLAEDESQIIRLLQVKNLYENGYMKKFENALKDFEAKNIEELQQVITTVQTRIEKARKKISQNLNPPEEKIMEEKIIAPKKPADVTTEEWIDDIKLKKAQINERKQIRNKRRQDLAKRRTAAAQERMRIISQLARKEKGSDDFGMRDEDWNVYKAISRENGDSDSEAENEKLLEYDEILRHWDPKNVDEPVGVQVGTAEYHQLHVGVELIRAPELLFQPSMMGISEAGLAELIEYIFKLFKPEEQQLLADNVFMTGGCSLFPGLKDRMWKELLEMRPFQSSFNIFMADSAQLDAWFGAKDFAQSENSSQYFVTKQDYLEKGGEYLKEHSLSNFYFPTPAPLPTEQPEC